MSSNAYEEVTTWLFQRFPSYQQIGSSAYKPTLENTQRLLERIGHPEKHLRFIHVAGSNGKGSVCSMLASILTVAGERTGLFTSPHIVDYRERIRVNGTCIEKQSVIDFVAALRAEPLDFEPSFFEITFALALFHFKQSQCTYCVIETGLGGRLDATNVIDPIACAITTISLEHTQFLGDTLEAIAREKSGIIKKGRPTVLGKLPVQADAVCRQIALERGSELIAPSLDAHSRFKLPLLGTYQAANFDIVYALCELIKAHMYIDDIIIQRGLDELHVHTGFIGRLQIVSQNPLVIFDVSHNAEGISASLESVRVMNRGQLRIVYGTSNDKDMAAIVSCFEVTDQLYLTEFSNLRSMKMNALQAHFEANSSSISGRFTDPKKALNMAKSDCSEEDTILVMGSFFLLADFL